MAIVVPGTTTAAVWAAHAPPVVSARLNRAGANTDAFASSGSLVLLDPENWPGKPFLLASHIDIRSQLRQGRWIVLLVHHDCDECLRAVPKYQAVIEPNGTTKLAVVEMPPYGGPGEPAPWPKSIGVFGQLDTTRDWFATTPVAILLKDGIVQATADAHQAVEPEITWSSGLENRLKGSALKAHLGIDNGR